MCLLLLALITGGTNTWGDKIYGVFPDSGEIIVRDTDKEKELPDNNPDEQVTYNNITFRLFYMDVRNDTNVGFDGATTGPLAKTRLKEVLQYIAGIINESGTLDVLVKPSLMDGTAFLATAGTYYFNSPGFQTGFTMQRLHTGIKPYPGYEEIAMQVDFNWNWNLTANSPSEFQVDFMSVLLHELTHGLGFVSVCTNSGGSGIGPNVYTVWDQLIIRRTGKFNLFGGSPPSFLGVIGDLTSNNIAFEGTQAYLRYDHEIEPGVYAPSSWADGSSLTHWNTGQIVGGAVMEHQIASGTMRREWAPVDIGGLIDLGYGNIDPVCTKVASTAVPRGIDFWGAAQSTIAVTDTRTITDLNVKLSIEFSGGDGLQTLTVALRSPAGTNRTLFSGVGGYTSYFTNTVLDDDAASAIITGSPPYTGCYLPQNALSAFNGQSAAGTWTLTVSTTDVSYTGSLSAWSLEFNCECGAEGEGEGEGGEEGEGAEEGEGEGTSEGQTEGATEGETQPTCSIRPCPNFDAEGAAFYDFLNATHGFSLNWTSSDWDVSIIPDSWEVAVLADVMCESGGYYVRDAKCDFLDNLATLRTETVYATEGWEPYENVVAALVSISTEMQMALQTVGLTQTYKVAGVPGKAAGEPFSPAGDLDHDSFTNLQEYNNVRTLPSEDQERSVYVTVVLHPWLDGTQLPGDVIPLSNNIGLVILLIGIALTGPLVLRRISSR